MDYEIDRDPNIYLEKNVPYNETIKENKKLLKEYPFLMPYEDEDFNKLDEEKYDYSYTFLDDIPKGWKKTFGKLLCEDLKTELVKNNILDKYKILQLKEKYASLRLYDNGVPKDSKIPEIISKYERISEHTCVKCGAFPVERLTRGWIVPICESCYKEIDGFGGEYLDNTEFNPFDSLINIKSYSKDGIKEYQYDVSDIVERIKK